MSRALFLALALGAILLSAEASARSVDYGGPNVQQMLEPLWAPLFSGGIVIGLAIYVLLRAIRSKRPE